MERNLIKGILATVQNDGVDLTEFKSAVLDVNDQEALTKALCCVVPNEYRYIIDGIECHIFADDSGVHDEEAIVTMIIKENVGITHVLIKNLFICKVLNGHVTSLSDDECAIILCKLKTTYFGYFPMRYLFVEL